MSIACAQFGEVDGQPIERFCMRNRSGTSAAVLTLGANLHSVRTRGRDGCDEITLAYDDVAGYLAPDGPYFGATAGRVANRIAGGAFSLDGTRYRLACNHGSVHLHGGEVGFDRRIWQAAAHEGDGEDRVVLRYVSPDGEEGYPGTLTAEVTYRLTDGDELSIDLRATTDAPTIVNLTNHTYWNLAGAGSGSIEEHELRLHCSQVLEKDADAPVDTRTLHESAARPAAKRHSRWRRVDPPSRQGGWGRWRELRRRSRQPIYPRLQATPYPARRFGHGEATHGGWSENAGQAAMRVLRVFRFSSSSVSRSGPRTPHDHARVGMRKTATADDQIRPLRFPTHRAPWAPGQAAALRGAMRAPASISPSNRSNRSNRSKCQRD